MKCSLIVVQSLRHVRLYDPMASSMPGFPVHHISLSLLKLMSIELVMPSNHLTLWYLLLFSLIFHSIRIFSNVLALCIRWLKCWSFSISLSSEYSRLVSFRIDWFDLLAVQGSLKSLLQYHSLKASIIHFSAFFMVQLSHVYVTNGKIVALTIQTFVSVF